NYLKFFERARTEWLRSLGIHQQALREATGGIFVVAEARLTYHQPARLDDELRATAQGFIAGGKAVFLATVEDPPALLLAASADSGIHAGNAVKSVVTALGGRGGGSAQMAQGSLPSREALAAAIAQLKTL
ncbi:MAG TPA: hotdog domain-containing protein, partial [Bryobacteraceae bacterium]|nr:hotdog domain-containing protein [Bryobacteraceae bacterium]